MKRLIFLFLILFLIIPSFAQEIYGAFSSTGPTFGWNPRALGMGNAFCAIEGSIDGIIFNPATISRLLNSQFSISYNYLPLTTESLGFGTEMYISSSYIAFGVPDTGLWASGVFYTRISPSEDLGILYVENQLAYSAAKTLDFMGIKNLALGINLKKLWINMPSPYKGDGWSVDLGILLRLFSNFNLGFSAQNLFSSLTWYDGENVYEERLQNCFKVGLSYQSSKFILALDLDFPSLNYHVGLEYFFDPIYLRLGWNIDSPTFGLGFRSPDGKWKIDYALLYSLGIGGIHHRIGLSLML
ncbi:MAG: hypothetical protein NZ841_07575 [Dictyoglomus sp.]|nr:hypothetical protein [Dictyoglomus sp.]MCX7845643.1 hypothetical protein [Dictyoglomaceae bacterium]MDW8189138.1 hypothetical protein [Dictyoglomus sp.]